MIRETIIRVIGALAEDIRGDWSNNVDDRINQMISLCCRLGEIKWLSELESNRLEIECDGRWLRDCWKGPYGGEVTLQDLKNVGLDKDIFNCPESIIKVDRDKAINFIGALAKNIEHDNSYNFDHKIDTIIYICKYLGEDDWIMELEENRNKIFYNKEWIKKSWSGPYGGKVNLKDLEYFGLDTLSIK